VGRSIVFTGTYIFVSTTKTSSRILRSFVGRLGAGQRVSSNRFLRALCIRKTIFAKLCLTGGFSQRALGGTPIAAFAWYDHQVNIRVYWQNNTKAVLESEYANGWFAGSQVANDIDERCPFTAVELQNGQQYRVYLRDHTNLMEKCKGKYDGYWFDGVFVIR
jgi:hypothetical protein